MQFISPFLKYIFLIGIHSKQGLTASAMQGMELQGKEGQ